jgi:hypothetical protein
VAALNACPLCRAVLEDDGQGGTCPSCGGDLRPFVELAGRAKEHFALASQLVSAGRLTEAREILDILPQLAELPQGALAALRARLLLQEDRLEEAGEQVALCEEPEAGVLRDELGWRINARRTAQEMYNSALSAARRGEMAVSAEELARAVLHVPSEAALWQLKLKVDLKCSYFNRCYEDLSALDRLGSRPSEFAQLEQLLPPVA